MTLELADKARQPAFAGDAPSFGQMTYAQKAAAVLIAVGPQAAGSVLAHMTEAEVETVALEVATLGHVAPTTLDAILKEFHEQAVAHEHLLSGGEEHARAMLQRWRGDQGNLIVDRLLATVQTKPFSFLSAYDPGQLIQHVRGEHPQTIALILAHLPARFSAQVLASLEPDLQSEVAVRVATMEGTSPEVVTRVEAALLARIGEATRGAHMERGGVKELAAMLNNADRGTERSILGSLEISDPDLANEVRALMFVFEDIVALDDRSLQTLLRSVDTKTLALALKGMKADVTQAVMRNLSERATVALGEEVELLGAVRLADVEAAQSAIVAEVRRLEDEGTITIDRGAGGDFVE